MRVPSFVSSLKRYTNRVCGRPLWQASYYDHIIRDENDLLNHWSYIELTPPAGRRMNTMFERRKEPTPHGLF